MALTAVALSCTLKPTPSDSSTDLLCQQILDGLAEHDVEGALIRVVDHDIKPGVTSDEGEGDAWPAIRERVLAAEILILATPTWLGQMSSVAKRALERMDAFLSESQDDGRPITYDKVAGFVVTGNEDGAHACIANVAQALIDIGYTIPGQAWTYWNKGPGPGDEEYLTTDDREWTHSTGDAAAHVLFHTAAALAAHPIPKPPNA